MKKSEAIEKLRTLYSYDKATILVSGKWGIGKTYFIKEFLESQKVEQGHRYIRISTFGANGLEEVRRRIGMEYLSSSIAKGGPSKARQAIYGITKSITELPFLRNYAGGISNRIEEIGYLMVKNATVWIDDLERRSEKVTMSDILGEITFLSEERNCKIIVACNSDQFSEDARLKSDFEKTIQFSFEYARDFEEIFECAFGSDKKWAGLLFDVSKELSILNIRNLTRIMRFVEIAENYLSGIAIPEPILRQIAMTIAISVESKYGQHIAIPSLENLKTWKGKYVPKESETSIYLEQNTLLMSLGYVITDELDKLLIDLVSQGSIDAKLLKQKVSENSQKIRESEAEARLHNAWGTFHGYFNKSDNEIIQAFLDALKVYSDVFPARRYDEIISLLKEIGRTDAISSILDLAPKHFPITHSTNDFELSGSNKYEYQPEILARIIQTVDEEASKASLHSIVFELSKSGGWSSSDEEVLAAMTVGEYENFISTCEDGRVDRYINRLLEFGEYAIPSNRQIQIAQNTAQALNKLAEKSPTNFLRTVKYRRRIENVLSKIQSE